MAKWRLAPLGDGLYRVIRNRKHEWRTPSRPRTCHKPPELAAGSPSSAAVPASSTDVQATATQRFQQLIAEVGEAYTPTGVLVWLNSSNHHFDGESPCELIERGTDDDWAQLLNESGRLASW